MSSPPPIPAVEAYFQSQPAEGGERLRALRAVIVEAAPEATEKMSYGLPTWHQGENLIHIGAAARHIGLYPGPEAIVHFAAALTGFVSSKGAIQVPYDRPLPLSLVREIVLHRLIQAAARKKKTRG
jgi:uncharacterized protein YdhG (YjbR/CyaY superfamily)